MKKTIRVIFLFFILLLGYYAVVFEPGNIKIEGQAIAINNLPQAFDGIKIVHLSDTHSYWFGGREKKVLRMLEELNPDFVFITGDFVDPITKAITDRDLSSVRIFWQKLGEKYQGRIFGVLGNHDTPEVKKYLKESQIVILNNENKKLNFGQEFIFLVGVDDPWTGRDNLSKAMEGVEENQPKILLAHAAEIIDEVVDPVRNDISNGVEKKIDLVLVGHTHGGQVNIPLLGEIIQPLSEYGRKYTAGLFKINSTYLYVNRGIGTSIFPIRFNCPPEITLIELRQIQ